MKDLETVKKIYKLSEEEHDRIQEQIISIMLYDKHPVEHPKAIIDIAPPASGKTGLNGFGKGQFVDNNVVIINSDELKPFHPKVDEIARLYPEYYTKVTDQESNSWTSVLFDTALKMGYNVIFEGTGRNARILETIKSKMQNYEVIVRGMAVNELNCLISILERYEYQVERKGWGRLVTSDHFYETYNAMPNTIEAIEESGVVNAVEIYRRGNSPTQPTMIYDSKSESKAFPNAKNAVIIGRNQDRKIAIDCFEEKFEEIKKMIKNKEVIGEEKSFIEKIVSLYGHMVEEERKGLGKLVTSEQLYKIYDVIPNTIEKAGEVDAVEIYKIGNSPMQPKMIYDSKSESKTFPNAKCAAIIGKSPDKKVAAECFDQNFEGIQKMVKSKQVISEQKTVNLNSCTVKEEFDIESDEDR